MKCLLSLFILLSIVSCDKTKKAPQVKQKQEAPLQVGVVKVDKQNIDLSSELFGRVHSTNVAEIRPQVSGIIFERSFDEGSYVEKGQQLYQIDPARYKVALDLAKGKLDQAKATLYSAQALMKRFESLIRTNAISKQEYDNARASFQEASANVKIAEAEVESAEINLAYTKVFSPISGYAGKSSVTKGALVTANQARALTIVRSLDPVYVDLTFPGTEALQLRKRLGKYLVKTEKGEGLPVTIQLEAINEIYPHKGSIEARELAIDEESGAVGLRAIVPNPELLLLPGMFVKAYVDQLGFGEQVVIPQMAIERDKNGDANVWVITRDKSVERRRIQTGVFYKKSLIVESGLEEGELVAIDNFQKLENGMRVSPLLPEKQAQEEKGK